LHTSFPVHIVRRIVSYRIVS